MRRKNLFRFRYVLLSFLLITLLVTYIISYSQQKLKGSFLENEESALRLAAPEIFAKFCPNIPVYGGLMAIHADKCYVIRFSYAAVEVLDNVMAEENAVMGETLAPGEITAPIILWWTDFTHETGRVKQCGQVSCFFTNNRAYKDHPKTKAFMFYGTSVELHDLPLPRKPHHEWALLHEESPKNNWAFSSSYMMSLFNHTSTFKRESDYPITLQWLTSIEDIESKEYYHTVAEKNNFIQDEGLAPIAYIQSDCGAPSDRDNLVKMMSKYIKIDSLGSCMHNKDLPEHLSNNLKGMMHKDFYKLLSKYKFIMAAENAVCEDYITEKLWRTYYVGSIPIIYGSPTIKDLIPSVNSSIIIQDYKDIQSLVSRIQYINEHDDIYKQATSYKQKVTNAALLDMMRFREWGIDNDRHRINFIDGFQCHVCKQLHKPLRSPKHATSAQWGCPPPAKWEDEHRLFQLTHRGFWWYEVYQTAMDRVNALEQLINENQTSFNKDALENLMLRRRKLG